MCLRSFSFKILVRLLLVVIEYKVWIPRDILNETRNANLVISRWMEFKAMLWEENI